MRIRSIKNLKNSIYLCRARIKINLKGKEFTTWTIFYLVKGEKILLEGARSMSKHKFFKAQVINNKLYYKGDNFTKEMLNKIIKTEFETNNDKEFLECHEIEYIVEEHSEALIDELLFRANKIDLTKFKTNGILDIREILYWTGIIEPKEPEKIEAIIKDLEEGGFI